MKAYAVLMLVCVVGLAAFNLGFRDYTLASTPTAELKHRLSEAEARMSRAYRRAHGGVVDPRTGERDPEEVEAAEREFYYTQKHVQLVRRELWRRRTNAGVPVLMAVLSLVFALLGLPRWLRERRAGLSLASGRVELMTPEELQTAPEAFEALKPVTFSSRREAILFLRKAATAEHHGGLLGQVWKQTHYRKGEDGQRGKRLGTVWVAQVNELRAADGS